MGQLNFVLVQAVRIDREAMVVRGNLDAAAAHVFDGLIAAAVAEFEFEGAAAERPSEQLMSQADAEDRRGAEQPPDFGDDPGKTPGTAGPVGRKTPAGRQGVTAAAGVARGNDGNSQPAPTRAPRNVFLPPKV